MTANVEPHANSTSSASAHRLERGALEALVARADAKTAILLVLETGLHRGARRGDGTPSPRGGASRGELFDAVNRPLRTFETAPADLLEGGVVVLEGRGHRSALNGRGEQP